MRFKKQLFFCVFLFELINTACSIYQYFLTGKERMRSIGNFKLDHRIFIAVFPFNGFLRTCGRACKERMPIAHILENNKLVIFWMDILLHDYQCFMTHGFGRAKFLRSAKVINLYVKAKLF